MSFYQHKSGAQKRREKEQKDKETKRSALTLFDVGVKKHAPPEKDDSSGPAHEKQDGPPPTASPELSDLDESMSGASLEAPPQVKRKSLLVKQRSQVILVLILERLQQLLQHRKSKK